MKDYLNTNERLTVVFFRRYLATTEQMLKEWGERNNLTPEEKKAIKTSITWGLKGYDSVINRLNKESKASIEKSVAKSKIQVIDNYAIEQYCRDTDKKLSEAYKNDEFFKMVELMFHYTCNGCTRDSKDCELYNFFEKRCIPEFGGELENCRYAYKQVKKENS